MTQRLRIGAALAALMFGIPISIGHAQTGTPGSALSAYGCQFPAAPPAASADPSAFAVYGWQMFIALNWTPATGERGVPDCTKPIGTAPGTVWQTYKTVDEIFLPDGRNPGPWNSSQTALLLKQTAKASQAALASPIGTVMQPVGGWLIDQQGNPTYYEIAANKVSYDYIVANTLYNANNANADRTIAFPDGTVEVKASWRILTATDTTSRYLTTTAAVETFNDQGQSTGTRQVTIGLVGLHIIVKPQGFPQWVWTTFEQVDNVVPPPSGKATYFDPAAPADSVNQSPCQIGVQPCTPKPGNTFRTPDPLTRMTPIAAATDAVNKAVQAQFGATFVKYYELIGTQRPTNPADPGDPLGSPTPNILANVTLESYIQPISSCTACHSVAVSGGNRYKSDFSFLFIHAQAPKGGN